MITTSNIHAPKLISTQHMFFGDRSNAWNAAFHDLFPRVLYAFNELGAPAPPLHSHTCPRTGPMTNTRWALKPLRKSDNGGVLVQLHWLRPTSLTPLSEIKARDQLAENVLAQAGLSDYKSWGDGEGEWKGTNGKVFELGPWNGVGPSFEVLEMHWNMMRVAAICGALEWDGIQGGNVGGNGGLGVVMGDAEKTEVKISVQEV